MKRIVHRLFLTSDSIKHNHVTENIILLLIENLSHCLTMFIPCLAFCISSLNKLSCICVSYYMGIYLIYSYNHYFAICFHTKPQIVTCSTICLFIFRYIFSLWFPKHSSTFLKRTHQRPLLYQEHFSWTFGTPDNAWQVANCHSFLFWWNLRRICHPSSCLTTSHHYWPLKEILQAMMLMKTSLNKSKIEILLKILFSSQ